MVVVSGLVSVRTRVSSFWSTGRPFNVATRERRCHPWVKASAVTYASGSVDERWRFLYLHQAAEVQGQDQVKDIEGCEVK
jgi:hypothetical protein